MRVETFIPTSAWHEIAPAARAAENAGFDGLVSAEITGDPFAPLAFAAVATERIQIGTGIVVAFPRSPMVVAQTSWDLHAQSGGRFHLGLGSQVKGHIERRFSTPWTPPRAQRSGFSRPTPELPRRLISPTDVCFLAPMTTISTASTRGLESSAGGLKPRAM